MRESFGELAESLYDLLPGFGRFEILGTGAVALFNALELQ